MVCVERFGHGDDLLIYVCVLCSYTEPFQHGGDLLAGVLYVEPFRHGGDLLV